jgi:hypothetical protein
MADYRESSAAFEEWVSDITTAETESPFFVYYLRRVLGSRRQNGSLRIDWPDSAFWITKILRKRGLHSVALQAAAKVLPYIADSSRLLSEMSFIVHDQILSKQIDDRTIPSLVSSARLVYNFGKMNSSAEALAAAAHILAPYDSALSKEINSEYIDTLLCSFSKNLDNCESAPDQLVLLIGPGRSGTTSLSEYISSHKNVIGYINKEISYFDVFSDFSFDWYLSHFRIGKSGLTWLDVSPGTFGCVSKIPDILSSNIPIKVICTLRDPVDRLLSMVSHELFNGTLSGDPNTILREMLKFEDLRGNLIYHNRYELFGNIWQSNFKDEILFVFFDQLNEESQLGRLREFMGLRKDENLEIQHKNERRSNDYSIDAEIMDALYKYYESTYAWMNEIRSAALSK